MLNLQGIMPMTRPSSLVLDGRDVSRGGKSCVELALLEALPHLHNLKLSNCFEPVLYATAGLRALRKLELWGCTYAATHRLHS